MVYFREVRRLWTWVLLLVALPTPVVVVVTALPHDLGNHPEPHRVPHVLLGLPGLLAIWFSLGSLVTEVRETGVRWGRGCTTYNVSGNRGLRIELASGESVIVGSQRADELAGAIADRIGLSKRWSARRCAGAWGAS